jgi:hypothetical protein
VKEYLVESSPVFLVENEHVHHEVAEIKRISASNQRKDFVHVALVKADVGLFVAQFGRFSRH